MRMVLEGIRVVDWTVFQVGPYASAMLADLGADVIHVEPRERGDLLRGLSTVLGVEVVLGGRQINFEEHNRNKKSLAVDMGDPKGREVIYRLVGKSDVFITNYRPAAQQRYGMDYRTLSQHNPRIIYASASGFGLKGADAGSPGLDMLAQARSGAMMTAGEPDGPPIYPVPNLGDRATALALAWGVLAALLGRERLGVTQELSVSQLNTMVFLQGFWLMPVVMLGKEFPRTGRTKPVNALYNQYRCGDGRWLVLAALGRPGEWQNFCKAIDMPGLENDPRFADEDKRRQNIGELVALLDKVFATKPREEWGEAFRKFDVAASRINSLSDLLSDPQVLENDMIIEWNHPILGQVKFPGFPVTFSETPMNLRLPAPELGQHTEDILVEVCGYTWDEVSKLRDEGVI